MGENDICTKSEHAVSHSSWDNGEIGKRMHGESMHGKVKIWTKKEIAAFNKERKTF